MLEKHQVNEYTVSVKNPFPIITNAPLQKFTELLTEYVSIKNVFSWLGFKPKVTQKRLIKFLKAKGYEAQYPAE